MVRIFNPEKDELKFNYRYNLEEKNSLKKLFSDIRENQKLAFDDLRRVALWKLNRILIIPENVIQALDDLAKSKKISYNDSETKEVIRKLLECDGVSVPMASTILKFLRPDIFPIMDARANRALTGKRKYYKQYNLEVYLEYVEKIYDLREKTGLELDEIDEQLYCFDKKYNGKL